MTDETIKGLDMTLYKADLALTVDEFITKLMAPAVGNIANACGLEMRTTLSPHPDKKLAEAGAKYLCIEARPMRTIAQLEAEAKEHFR